MRKQRCIYGQLIGELLTAAKMIWLIIRRLERRLDCRSRFPQFSMDPALYGAAKSGDWRSIQTFSPAQISSQRTTDGNNLLHLLALYGDPSSSSSSSCDAVRNILVQNNILAFMKNRDGETPLVVASRRGHCEIVRHLIGCAKVPMLLKQYWLVLKSVFEMLVWGGFFGYSFRQSSKDAVLEAVRFDRYEVVRLFAQQMPESFEDDESLGQRRPRPESALYAAVQEGRHRIAALMLSGKSKSMAYNGPLGKTVLHAAALRNSPPELVEKIVANWEGITRESDVYGWTALHYAAKFNHKKVVETLLTIDKSMGYIFVAKEDDFKTALHVATIAGHLDTVRGIIGHCQYSWEMTTRKRQNILHLAVANQHKPVLEWILAQPWVSELINKKDAAGNTPLHLYATTDHLDGSMLVEHSCLNRNALNKKLLTPLDLASEQPGINPTIRQNSLKEELKNAGAVPGLPSGEPWTIHVEPETKKPINGNDNSSSKDYSDESYMLIATLIIAAAFGAGFSMPGGYDAKGKAVLRHNGGFHMFIVCDSLAISLSVIALIIQLFLKETTLVRLELILPMSKVLIVFALISLMVGYVGVLFVVMTVETGIFVYLLLAWSTVFSPMLVFLVLILVKFFMAGAYLRQVKLGV